MSFFQKITVARPEWLPDGLDSAIRTFTLAKNGILPDSIQGAMLVVSCMRVLRSIYGDDLTTACAIRERVLANEEEHRGCTCWWNPETGYLEACQKHEGEAMDRMMEHEAAKKGTE